MQKFWSLTCGRIETEAKLFAWIGIVLNSIISPIALSAAILLINSPCEEVMRQDVFVNMARDYTQSKNCQTIAIAALMSMIRTFSVALIELTLMIFVLIGIKKRKPVFVYMSFLYYVLTTIISFIWELSSLTSRGYIQITVPNIINFYVAYIFYAVYSKIRSECKEAESVEMQKV